MFGTHVEEHHHHHDHDEKGHHHTTKETKEATKKKLIKKKVQLEHYEEMIRELNKKVAHLQEKLKHATNTDEKTTVEKEINVIHTRIVKIEKKIKDRQGRR